MSAKRTVVFTIFVTTILANSLSLATDRNYQPVVIKTDVFEQMHGAPIDRLILMVF